MSTMDNGFSRYSFDRYGDDLCQLLLSYLSISDCFRFECVSKQWKSLLFTKQRKVIISSYGKEKHYIQNVVVFRNKKYILKKSSLECVLRKCSFITDLVFDYNDKLSNDVFDMISNNCRFLKSFKSNAKMNGISDQSLKLFAEKCGQTIEILHLKGDTDVFKRVVPLIPNLKEIHFHSVSIHNLSISVFFNSIINDNLEYYNELNILVFIDSDDKQVLPKLEEIDLTDFCLNNFKIFADKYCKQIKKLKAFLNHTERELVLLKMDNVLTQLSRFENIEKLDICLIDYENIIIDNGLRLIGDKCKKLVELKINGFNANLFNCFYKNFYSLRKLALEGNGNELFDGRVECLKCCVRLTHLSLDFVVLSDDHFECIDIYLPHLKYLKITYHCFNDSITDNTLHSLAKMRNLSVLKISLYNFRFNRKITDEGVCDVINNCDSITTIKLNIKTKVTQTSLNALIERAKLNPKIEFKFDAFLAKNSDIIVKNVPNNISSSVHTINYQSSDSSTEEELFSSSESESYSDYSDSFEYVSENDD